MGFHGCRVILYSSMCQYLGMHQTVAKEKRG